jgi:hypothetical protein
MPGISHRSPSTVTRRSVPAILHGTRLADSDRERRHQQPEGREMDARTTGLLVVGFGILVILTGLLIMAGGLSWFGRLPGDIRYERGNTRVYVPITTMVLISLLLSLVSYLLRRVL